MVLSSTIIVPESSNFTKRARFGGSSNAAESVLEIDESQRETDTPGKVVYPNEEMSDNKKMKSLDQGSRERGKRFMGVLLGTLNRFKRDAVSEESKNESKRRLETIVAAKIKNERDEIQMTLKTERSKRRKSIVSSKLEQEQKVVDEISKSLKSIVRDQTNFLVTETEPKVFFLPALLLDTQEKLLSDQKNNVEAAFTSRMDPVLQRLNELKKEFTEITSEESTNVA